MKQRALLYISLICVSLVLGTAQANQLLDDVLAAQDDDVKARYEQRHPKETLEFFGIEPGMRVAEALPGGGWYSKILLQYLGKDGHLVGLDYAIEMWPEFGGFATPEFVEERKTWATNWAQKATPWAGENGASVAAGTLGALPEGIAGTMDAVLFIRAMHNLSRFEAKGGFQTQALDAAFKLLKPGGIVGIVQHQGREDRPDAWADGSNGYVKKSAILNAMQAAGFVLVAETSINENAKDQANDGDIVWRLPPSLSGAGDDIAVKEKMLEIGESHRMTLLFKKPESA